MPTAALGIAVCSGRALSRDVNTENLLVGQDSDLSCRGNFPDRNHEELWHERAALSD